MERRASAGRTTVPSRMSGSAPYSVSKARAPSISSGSRTASCDARDARQSSRSAGRLAQVRDRVVADVRVADAAVLQRVRAAKRDQPAVGGEQLGVPQSGRSHGMVRRASSPRPLRGRARRPRTPSAPRGVVICRPTPTSWRSRDPATVRKRAVSWLSSNVQEWTTLDQGRPARNARIVETAAAPGRVEQPTGIPQNACSSAFGIDGPRSQVHVGRRKPA